MANTGAPTVLRFGPFECDVVTGDLRKQGRPVKLQEQPRQVLVALLESPGSVVTRDALRRRLWPDDTFVDFDNALNVAIRKIREALGDVAPVAHYVETVRGQGYRFIAHVVPTPVPDAPLRVDLPSPPPRPVRPSSSWRFRAAVLIAVASVFTALGALGRPWIDGRAEGGADALTAFTLQLQSREVVNGHPAISPDGRTIVYASDRGDGVSRLRLQPLDTTEPRTLQGSEGASAPFMSPDGLHVAFFAGAKLRRMPIAGGPSHDVCDAGTPRGGSWGDDGFIVFADGLRSGLWRVAATGGLVERFTTLADGEANHRYPHVLPGSQAVLFTSVTADQSFRIAVQARQSTGHRVLVPDGQNAQYGAGGLVYGTGKGEIFSAKFDVEELSITGAPTAHAERPRSQIVGDLDLSVARDGTMVYLPSQSFARRLAILDRHGAIQALADFPVDAYDTPRVSPDGSQILVSIRAGLIEQDVWLLDLRGRTRRRVTTDGNSRRPLWTPDGQALTFDRRSGGQDHAFLVPVSATQNDASQITHASVYAGSAGWVGDDFFYNAYDSRTLGDVWRVTRGRAETARPVVVRDRVQWGRPSPNGKWLALVSNETGPFEIYVTSLPTPGVFTKISDRGGNEPVWSKSSDQLFYRRDGEIVGVRVSSTGPDLTSVRSIAIADVAISPDPHLPQYDVFGDGSFVLLQDEAPPATPTPTVVLRWARGSRR